MIYTKIASMAFYHELLQIMTSVKFKKWLIVAFNLALPKAPSLYYLISNFIVCNVWRGTVGVS